MLNELRHTIGGKIPFRPLDDMYKTYDDVPLQYDDTYSFHGKEYLDSKNPSTYTWDYQDTVNLKFKVDCRYRECLLKATVYNFRGEPIFQLSDYMDCCNNFNLNIDHIISTNFFTKGTYSCVLLALRPINEEENEVETIMPREACTFYVR